MKEYCGRPAIQVEEWNCEHPVKKNSWRLYKKENAAAQKKLQLIKYFYYLK